MKMKKWEPAGINKKPSWRIMMLAKHKYYTPKVTEPYEFVNFISPSTLNGRQPERVMAASYPYERILLDTKEKFAEVLTPRSKQYISDVLAQTSATIYAKLVKRPICTGPQAPERKPPEYDEKMWMKHRDRIIKLSKPKKDFTKQEKMKREYRKLSELLVRLEVLAKPPEWRIYKRLSKDPAYKDPTKLCNPKALQYVATPRMLELAKPKKTEDCSLEGTLATALWEKFLKKMEIIEMKRRRK